MATDVNRQLESQDEQLPGTLLSPGLPLHLGSLVLLGFCRSYSLPSNPNTAPI